MDPEGVSFGFAVRTRLELVTSCVTGRHSNQTELTHLFRFGSANIDIFLECANGFMKKMKNAHFRNAAP